ncbi:hypothetical protein B0H16DRAFT_1490853 [Mycena metata]|uniref:Uncharacterized protein n=1 Tax=Mycena metata TaxID=1033252 RepID=A0AAD7P3P1_9AGAR|nr:hypothetical protein B0H16DRAFT_1490853 [Mycena metata]
MPKASKLPTSSTDFNLPPSTSAPPALATGYLDDTSMLFQRFRRPSLLAPKATHLPDSRLHSPLAASFKSHKRRASHSTSSLDDSDTLWTDITPPSGSENPTPPLVLPEGTDDATKPMPPLTPPRRSLSRGADLAEARLKGRRLSFPIKQPRILNLLAESRPVESEVQSEAAFQRLLASGVELPRTPRTVADRGRYPEEAGPDEFQREDTPSDDGDGDNDSTYTPFYPMPSGSEPINIRTPAGSVNGDDLNTMCLSESPGISGMDVDLPSASPSMSSVSSMSIHHWRSTPPPTTSAVRSNKRKFDERFDPYQNASKRRAVSPSLSHLRDSHPSSPKSRSNPRLPIAIPILPASAASSTTSSPTVGVGSAAFLAMSRPVNGISSPTLRPAMALASPILRPVPRSAAGVRRGEGEEREIEGTGEWVGCLSLGS